MPGMTDQYSRQARNERMYAILHDTGQRNEDVKLLGSLRDMRAAETYKGEPLSKEEFCRLIGLEIQADGSFDIDVMINACMGIEDVEAVRGLPDDQRIRAISTSLSVLDIVFGRPEA